MACPFSAVPKAQDKAYLSDDVCNKLRADHC